MEVLLPQFQALATLTSNDFYYYYCLRRGGGGGNVYKASTDETINYPITTNERIKVFSRN
jgi:hypothetical protein